MFDDAKNKASEWIADFENVADINEWTNENKMRFVSLSLNSNAKRWLNGLDELPSWENFKKLFIERYEIKSNAEIVKKLRSIRKYDNEQLLDYLDRCIELFRKYEGNLDETIKLDYISAGLPHFLQVKVIEKKLTFGKLRNFFVEQQKIDNLRSERQSDNRNRTNTSEEKKPIEEKKFKEVKCFGCGKIGHFRKDCKSNSNDQKNENGTPLRQDVSKKESPQH